MQLVIFMGIQAAGKSTFFRERFVDTHTRINLDMLRTRHRERVLFEACLTAKQSVVVDNTNVSRSDRARYIGPARAAGFSVEGYYFRSVRSESVARNAAREHGARVPIRGLLGTAARLEIPKLTEGFDTLHYVRIGEGFVVEPWERT